MAIASSVNPFPKDPTPTNNGTGTPVQSFPMGTTVQSFPMGTTVPTVSVGNNGLLELPYDQSYATGALEAISGANNELLGIKAEEDNQGLSYQKALRDSSGAYGQQRRTTKNVNASGGTLFSSRYGTGVVNDATAYANQVGEIESQNSAFTQNANLRKTAIQTALQNQLASLTQAYADKLGEKAGTLGYGQDKSTHQNTAKQNAYKKARHSYDSYKSAYSRAQQLSAKAKQSGSKADKQAAQRARAAAEKLRSQFKNLNQTYKDYS